MVQANLETTSYRQLNYQQRACVRVIQELMLISLPRLIDGSCEQGTLK